MPRLLLVLVTLIWCTDLLSQSLKPTLSEWHSRFNLGALRISNDANYLITMGDDNAVVVTDLKRRTPVIKIHQTGELMLETNPEKPVFYTALQKNDSLEIAHRSLPNGEIFQTTRLPETVKNDWKNSRFAIVAVLYEGGTPQFWVPYDSVGLNRLFCFNENGEILESFDLPQLTYTRSVIKHEASIFVAGFDKVLHLKNGKAEKYFEVDGDVEFIGNMKLMAGTLVILTTHRIIWCNIETGKKSAVRIPGFFASSISNRNAGLLTFRHPFGIDAALNVWVASQELLYLKDIGLAQRPYAMACIAPSGKITWPFMANGESGREKEPLGDHMDMHTGSGLIAMQKDNEVLLADVKNGVQFSAGRKNLKVESLYFTATPGKILLQVKGMQSPGFLVNLANGRMETIGVLDDVYYSGKEMGKEILPKETYEALWWPSHRQYYQARYYVYRNDAYLRYPFKDAYFPPLTGNRMLVSTGKGELQLQDMQGKMLKKLNLFGLVQGSGDKSYVNNNTYVPAKAKKTAFTENHIIKSCFYDSAANTVVLTILQNFTSEEFTNIVIDLSSFTITHFYYGDDILIHPGKGLLITSSGIFSLKDHNNIFDFSDSARYGHSFTLSPDLEYLYFYVNGYERGDRLFGFHFKTKKLQYMGRQQGIDLIVVDPHLPRVFTKGLDNTVIIWDGISGKELATLALSGMEDIKELRQANGSYLVIQPDGNYMGTHQYFKMLKLRDGKKSYSINEVDAVFHRPDIVLEQLGYAATDYLRMVKKQATLRSQKVKLQADADDAYIANKTDLPWFSDDGEVNLKIHFPGSFKKYNGYKIYVNGTALSSSTVSIEADKISIPVVLVDEVNHIRVCLVNSDRQETPGDYLYINSSPAAGPVLYLAGIGVSEYADSTQNLKYAVKDMNDLLNFFSLTDSYVDIKAKRFSNKAVTPAVIDSIRYFLKEAKSRDVVICYYAGHGMLDSANRYFLSTYAFNFARPAENGISVEKLNDAIAAAKARKKIVFLDACHSGLVDDISTAADTIYSNAGAGVATRGVGRPKKQNASEVAFSFNHFNQGSGVDIVAAAAGNEFAYELGSIRNGVFTYSMLKALKSGEVDYDNNGTITLGELQLFVADNTRKLTRGAQQPTFRQNNLYQDIGIIKTSDTYLNRFITGAGYNDVRLLTLLLDNGEVEINQKDKEGFTALTMASREGSYEAVKFLVSRGADVQRTTDFGFSSLYLSAWNKHIRITYFLLKNGASVAGDIVQWQKEKILGNNVAEISQMLLDFGAVEARQNILTKLGAALINGNIAAADSIWATGKIDINGQLYMEGMPLIAMAVLGEKESAVAWALGKGANINVASLANNYTPLMFAVSKGNAELVKLLLIKGADKSLKDIYGKTALDYARTFGHTAIVTLLQ